uniref:NYN domain-containing protein n=1 Tax=Noccaea caerulescens TaxID=107243 RepID=A0A1J3GXQ1_NOCCA
MMQNKSPAVVWWDMNTCPPPEKLDPSQIRQSLESAFPHLLPFTISAHGDLNLIPRSLWEPILSSGIILKHGPAGSMPGDMRRWRDNNPPPATLFLISDSENVCEILPSFKVRGYTITGAVKQNKPEDAAKYASLATISWDHILSVAWYGRTTGRVMDKCSETAWVCNMCIDSSHPFAGESYESLTRHMSSAEHSIQESIWMNPSSGDEEDEELSSEDDLDNEMMQNKKTGVWWDMDTCPPPEGLDPYQVRQSIESMFSDHLPLNVSAIGNLNSIDAGVFPILSAGFFTKHGLGGPRDILKDIQRWAWNTPSPATLVLISDDEQAFLTSGYLHRLKEIGYTIVRVCLECPDVSPEYASLRYTWRDVLSGKLNREVDKVKDKCSETAWFCNVCINSGHIFAGESYQSLTRHFNSAQHSFQELKQVPPKLKASQSKKAIWLS